MTDTPRQQPDDATFLAEYDASAFARPTVAVDVVVLTVVERELRCLLMQRPEPPHAGRWSLPGVIVGIEEGLDSAARRALSDKAGLTDVFVEQLYTFGAPDRDPRTRMISVAHLALLPHQRLADTGLAGATTALATVTLPPDARAGDLSPLLVTGAGGAPLDLAFDHAAIIATAVERIRGKLDYAAIGYELLPELFPLRDLQRIHETILGRELNTDSFRRRIVQSGLAVATGVRETETTYRPAELYRFARDHGRRD